eukprot:jgi/Botrbrau1/9533/Bobra.0211s0024.1
MCNYATHKPVAAAYILHAQWIRHKWIKYLSMAWPSHGLNHKIPFHDEMRRKRCQSIRFYRAASNHVTLSPKKTVL